MPETKLDPKAVERAWGKLRVFSPEEWSQYPRDHFPYSIKSWCQRFNLIQFVDMGTGLPAALPYRRNKETGSVEVAESFLSIVEQRRLDDDRRRVQAVF